MSKPRVNRHAFTFMIPLPLWERLQKAIEVTRRSVTAEMTLALEERLTFLEKGLSPTIQAKGADDGTVVGSG